MSSSSAPLRRVVTIRNQRGLHARAAAKFVKCAALYPAQITVSKDGTEVVGQSIMGLMMLAAACGSEIEITASGEQAAEALDALCTLVENGFGELQQQ
jgi:phosphocarrier protein HPr